MLLAALLAPLLAALAAAQANEKDVVDGFRVHCGGKGQQFCKLPWASECPPECSAACGASLAAASSSSPASASSASASTSTSGGVWDGVRDDLKFALNRRMFDQAFIFESGICVANCKNQGFACAHWSRFWDRSFCQALACTKGIDGCHQDKDFAGLTCALCVRAFPRCWAAA